MVLGPCNQRLQLRVNKVTICVYNQECHASDLLFVLKVGDSGQISVFLAADILTRAVMLDE